MEGPLVNRVANSGLITIKLEDYFPAVEFDEIDIKDYLFQGLILKEKDFRSAIKEIDWTRYQDKVLLIYCSTDAIIPVWAYMLISAQAAPYAKHIYFGNQQDYLNYHYRALIDQMDTSEYDGQRIVIKGCSEKEVPASAYLYLTQRLQPFAQSIMYGEPCSTVPIFKRPRKIKK